MSKYMTGAVLQHVDRISKLWAGAFVVLAASQIGGPNTCIWGWDYIYMLSSQREEVTDM